MWNTLWLDFQISQNNFLLAGVDLIDLSLMGGCEVYLFIYLFIIKWAVVKACHIHRNCLFLLCMIICLILCMPFIHSWSRVFHFWCSVFISIHFVFSCLNFLSGCTLSLKRGQQKKSLLTINTTKNSVLFCSYWLKEPFSLG